MTAGSKATDRLADLLTVSRLPEPPQTEPRLPTAVLERRGAGGGGISGATKEMRPDEPLTEPLRSRDDDEPCDWSEWRCDERDLRRASTLSSVLTTPASTSAPARFSTALLSGSTKRAPAREREKRGANVRRLRWRTPDLRTGAEGDRSDGAGRQPGRG